MQAIIVSWSSVSLSAVGGLAVGYSADDIVAEPALGVQHPGGGECAAVGHIHQFRNNCGGSDIDGHAEDLFTRILRGVFVVYGRANVDLVIGAVFEDPVFEIPRGGGDGYSQVGIDDVLTGENLSAFGLNYHGALAARTFAAAYTVEDNAHLPRRVD